MTGDMSIVAQPCESATPLATAFSASTWPFLPISATWRSHTLLPLPPLTLYKCLFDVSVNGNKWLAPHTPSHDPPGLHESLLKESR